MESTILINLLFVGVVIVGTIGLRYASEQIRISPVVAFFVLGALLRAAASYGFVPFLLDQQVFPFLADLGVIVLLFQVGLDSNLSRLLAQLPDALWVSAGDVLVSGSLAFAATYGLLGWALIPSLFVSAAFSATSVGVTVAVWQDADQLNTREGSILVDVAEVDDLTGILFMALLLSVVPILQGTAEGALLSAVGTTLAWTLAKFALFGTACLLFALYLEGPMTRLFDRLHAGEGIMLVMVGVGIIVAAAAGLSGLSIAVGAFFAGLIFHRDVHTTQYMDAFRPLHDLLAPFFFVSIGLHLTPEALGAVGGSVLILFIVAVVGKVLGASLPAMAVVGSSSAFVLGLSLVPRAEIALVIMQRGLELGDWAVSPDVFAQVVLVSAATVLFVPIVLRPLLRRSKFASY